MGIIQVMPDALANQIAAGEVVERPASCVKELVENSLDAGATEIRVSLEEGGIAAMVVQDNGHGMDPDDAVLAFARHATSKVRSARDLFKIATLGFRGEALASIAAVARVRLETRPRGSESGIVVQVEGSRQTAPPAPVGMPEGTRIEVRDLFFNTPARLKYLRSVTTEQARCLEVVQKAALARPDVAFVLETNGHVMFQSGGRGNLLEVAAAVFGAGEARQMLSVEGATPDYRIHGLIGRPTQARASRAHAHLFINDRPIRNYALHQAVMAGFGARLMTKRHPMYVLYLQMDPALVDVNIHPHKAEVRFSEERDVARVVQDAVQRALDEAFLVPSIHIDRIEREASKGEGGVQARLRLPQAQAHAQASAQEVRDLSMDPKDPSKAPSTQGRPDRPSRTGGGVPAGSPVESQVAHSPRASYRPERAPFADRPQEQDPRRVEVSRAVYEQVAATLAPTVEPAPGSEPASVSRPAPAVTDSAADADGGSSRLQLRPVGQALGMYIIADDGESLYVIDQHAAHERVLYERFRAQVQHRVGSRIPLLTPLNFRLTPVQFAAVSTYQETLAGLGFEIEPFGGTDVLLRTVPEVWEGLDIAQLSEQLFESLAADKPPRDAAEALRERVVMQACKAAIKANHHLSHAEMDALCQALSDLEDPFHCPHGRPVLIRLTSHDLEKEFRRIV